VGVVCVGRGEGGGGGDEGSLGKAWGGVGMGSE